MKYAFSILAILVLTNIQTSFGARKVVLDAKIEEAIEEFYTESPAGKQLAKKAKGMLVFPTVGKAGFMVGGEYGEGALIIKGKKVQYYKTVAASVGLVFGAQSKRQIILFMEQPILDTFRDSEGWEVGVDGNVAIATLGAGGEVDTKTLNHPVVAFVFGNKGLMADLSLAGSKFSKIEKKK